MQIDPRYEGPPIVTVEGDGNCAAALVRQRQRLAATLESLSDDEWAAPSRCEDWTVQDVATHLVSVNGFWRYSILAGLAGEPTRLLVDFDPKATPAALVEAAGEQPPTETLAQLVASSDALCEVLEDLDDGQWDAVAETPVGLIPVRLLALHALWDCWVHERDIVLPLGRPEVTEPDEVMAGLQYVAGLGPAFVLASGRATPASLVLETTEPDGRVVVEVGERITIHDRPVADPSLVVRGRAVDLVEQLSARAPLAAAGSVPDEHRWLVASLAEVFESL
ncbi:MAG TPA: maleylpyruvate isomerase N-terminal domain-containing protein [Acidimicrobiales bacterium]